MVNIVDSGGGQAPQELETFLPKNGTNGVKYKITPTKKDPENGIIAEFNPFAERQNEHPTTDGETLTHLLKASLGTGILAMPVAFKHSGIVLGIFVTIFTAFICTHCSYVLVKCGHKLYVKTRTTKMSFAEVAQAAFLNGPKWGRKFAGISKISILICLFLTYFGTCSVYTVIIAKNIQQVAIYISTSTTNTTENLISEVIDSSAEEPEVISLRLLISMLLIPLIILSWVPNLKYLAPVSMVANGFMALGLGITFYYLVIDVPSISEREMYNIYSLPAFFAITIFAMEAIGVVMPLENSMRTPQNFIGICGVLNQGMSGVTLIYMLLGFMGYLKYGEETEDSITLNLPKDEIPAHIVKIAIALAVYCTYGLQFFVCLEIAWDAIKDKCRKRPMIVNYVLRTVLVTASVVLAVAVPTIGPFMGLIGAFCFSILGLLFPVFIEMVTYWHEGFGPGNWIVWKNIVVVVFGILALAFGSHSAINDIVKLYSAPLEEGST